MVKLNLKFFSKIVEFIIVSLICFFICAVINKNINIKSLYMDDLENFYYFLRQDIFEYSFKTLENQVHFRPIFYFTLYIYYYLITGHIARSVLINIIINSIIGIEIYYVLKKLQIKKFLIFFLIVLFFISHFSYFQLGQCIGLIESEAMILAIFILLNCILYIKFLDKKYLIYNLFFLFLICFVHERYISMSFPIFISIFIGFIKGDKNKKFFLFLLCVILSILLIRFIKLNSIIPVGTDKTIIADNFDLKRSIKFFIEQFLYIFGYNMGPEYLSGINFFNLDNKFKIIIYFSSFILLFIFIFYFVLKLYRLLNKKINFSDFYIDIIFISFIFSCVISSSITIRLEMRWIYMSYLTFLIYVFYIVNQYFLKYKFLLIFLFTFCFLRFFIDTINRSYYKNIFFYNDLIATNSLADETIYKYGESVLTDKKIYITNNYFKLSGRWYRHFFEPFTGKKNEEVMLNELDNVLDVINLSHDDNNIVLVENVEKKTYERFKNRE